MRICLVNPGSPFLLDQKVFPPLGLMRISAVLKEQGVDVEVLDMNFERIMVYPKKWWYADYIMFSCTTSQYPIVLKTMKKMKVHNEKAKFVIGGPHPTVMPKKCALDGFDVVVQGDGESIYDELMTLQSNPMTKDWYPVILDMKPIENIDELPFPDRDCVRIKEYKYYIDYERATTIVSSRGCPYSCAFCCKMDKKVRFHSAQYVLSEIKMLRDKYGYNRIMFFDDLFILDKKRIEEICAGLKDMDIKFRCFVRADLVTQKMMNMLERSGCKEIGFGAESGSQKILDIINKRTTVEQNTKCVEMAHRAGLSVKAFLIVGLPGENWDTIKETEEWIRSAKPDSYDVSVFTPFPGTPIWDSKEKYDVEFDIGTDFSKMFYKGTPGEYNCLVRTKALTSEDIINARERLDKMKGEMYG